MTKKSIKGLSHSEQKSGALLNRVFDWTGGLIDGFNRPECQLKENSFGSLEHFRGNEGMLFDVSLRRKLFKTFDQSKCMDLLNKRHSKTCEIGRFYAELEESYSGLIKVAEEVLNMRYENGDDLAFAMYLLMNGRFPNHQYAAWKYYWKTEDNLVRHLSKHIQNGGNCPATHKL